MRAIGSALPLVLLLSPRAADGFTSPSRPAVAAGRTARRSLRSTIEDNASDEKSTVDAMSAARSINPVLPYDPADAFTDDSTGILGGPIPYADLTVGVLKETFGGENRVSLAPDSVRSLVDAGFTVVVESGGESFPCSSGSYRMWKEFSFSFLPPVTRSFFLVVPWDLGTLKHIYGSLSDLFAWTWKQYESR